MNRSLFSESPPETRARWVGLLERIALPVLSALAENRLRRDLPVEAVAGKEADRAVSNPLEAVGRTLAGIAPWLELASPASPEEARTQERLRGLARAALENAVDPASPDCLDFTSRPQALVDAAFLAQALLRAPETLFSALSETGRARLLDALRSTRAILPGFNNWLLFSAMVEAALHRFPGEADLMRIDYAVRQHDQWYKGDGVYGDGPDFHWDYYNSFVIQPFLDDLLEAPLSGAGHWGGFASRMRRRASRFAAVQERLIAPDGSFPVLGRSIAYRCGAFQLLAQAALKDFLPEGLSPARVRCGLNAVIRRTLEAEGTFDAGGWLRIGLAGAQPSLGEVYICTGSLYLCTAAFLPLGLPATHPFWSAPGEPWTGLLAWSGGDLPADSALKGA